MGAYVSEGILYTKKDIWADNKYEAKDEIGTNSNKKEEL